MYRYTRASKQFAFRSDYPITDAQILEHAPSILADEAHESRSERYAHISTREVLNGLRANGFQPYEVRQTKCRDVNKREHTKHMLRLRHQSLTTASDEVPEIILLNSHDGTSSYQLLSGIFRFVCSNGLIAGDVCDDIRVRHSGNVVDNVIDGATRVLDNIQLVTDRIDTYKAITLSQDEQHVLAKAAAQARWGDESPIHYPEQLNWARRREDQQSTLWNTFNRIQENVLKGGMGGRSASGRRTTTRAVQGVSENVKLNRALWTLADEMAKLKT